jgi:MFS transporter, ACS family, allantoate permease
MLYLSYLAFEFPQNLSPTFPGGEIDEVCLLRWRPMYSNLLSSFNISTWAVAFCAHAACKNFAGLFVVHLILGMCVTVQSWLVF